MKPFDVDLFFKFMSKKQKEVETKDISDWIESSVRHIQKYAVQFNIPFHRIHGRKYYIWDILDLYDLKDWLERNKDKPKKKYYIPVEKKINVKVEKVKKEKKIPFKTIKDIVTENYGDRKSTEGITRLLQKWAKENNVPFKYYYGRKYYIMTDELFELYKLELKERKQRNTDIRQKNLKKLKSHKLKDIDILKEIANE
jgi:c-di-AMP phosphodiesterase-like protein